MNQIIYQEIEIDGKLLDQHFVGRLGSHPGLVSPLGWNSASKEYRKSIVKQFLGEEKSELESGRIAVLVCNECGDIGCGAITVQIRADIDKVYWSNWAFENGYEPESSLTWPTQAGDLVFDRESYTKEIRKAL